MEIGRLLKTETIGLNLDLSSKEEVLEQMISLLEQGGILEDKEEYRRGVLAREAQGGTGIGGGLAIPHAKSKGAAKPGLAAATVNKGLDYQAADHQPVRLLFMIAAPENGEDLHLKILAGLARLLMRPGLKEELLRCGSAEEFLAKIKEAEKNSAP